MELLRHHHHFGQVDYELGQFAIAQGANVPLEPYRTGPWLQHLTALQTLVCPELCDVAFDSTAVHEGLSSCLASLRQLTRLQLSGLKGGLQFDGDWQLDLQGLPALQDLSIQTVNMCVIDTHSLHGLSQCSNLIWLELSGGLEHFEIQVRQRLWQLR
jgi:hypothetical protein